MSNRDNTASLRLKFGPNGEIIWEKHIEQYVNMVISNKLKDRNELLLELAEHLNLRTLEAQIAAAKAIGLLFEAKSPVSFDIDNSTSHVIFIRDTRTNSTRCITATDLQQILNDQVITPV